MLLFSACLCVLISSQFPCCSERARQYILARRRQANMCVSHLSPATRNRQENLRRLLHKGRLQLKRKHEVSVPLCLRGQRSEFPASNTKSRQSCVGVLFDPLEAQCNPAKVCCGHRVTPRNCGAAASSADPRSQVRVRTRASRRSFRNQSSNDVAFPHPQS